MLNLNPNFKELLEAYGIDTTKCTVNSNGKINGGSVYREGYWSFDSTNNIGYQSTTAFIAEDEKVCIERTWQLQDGKLVKLSEEEF